MGVVSRFQIPPDSSVAQMVEHTPTFFYMTTIAQQVEQLLGTIVCRWFDSISSHNNELLCDKIADRPITADYPVGSASFR